MVISWDWSDNRLHTAENSIVIEFKEMPTKNAEAQKEKLIKKKVRIDEKSM